MSEYYLGGPWGPPGTEFSLDVAGGSRGYLDEKVAEDHFRFREAVGADWAVVQENQESRVVVRGEGDYLLLVYGYNLFGLEFARASGRLTGITVAVTDILSRGLRQMYSYADNRLLMELQNGQIDGNMILALKDVDPRLYTSGYLGEQPSVRQRGLVDSSVGHIAGLPQCTWESNFEILEGKIGLEIYAGRVECYYQNGEKKVIVFQIPREVREIPEFDRLASNKLPNDEEMKSFADAILPDFSSQV